MKDEQIQIYFKNIPRNQYRSEIIQSSERIFLVTLSKYLKELKNLGLKESLYLTIITEKTKESHKLNIKKLYGYKPDKEINSIISTLIGKKVNFRAEDFFRVFQTYQDLNFYEKNKSSIEKILELIEQKSLYLRLIWSIVTGDTSFLLPYIQPIKDIYRDENVKPYPGNKVIVGGTTDISDILGFIRIIGLNGQYIGFEPSERQFEDIRNSNISPKNFKIEKVALSSKSKSSVRFDENGSKSKLGSGGIRIRTTTIDAYLHGTGCDLIKLNLNDSELEALEGAKQTLKRSHPKLMLHVPPDCLVSIPKFLMDLNLGYKFSIKYYDSLNTLNDIILYAEV